MTAPRFAEDKRSYIGLLAGALEAEGILVQRTTLHAWPFASMARARGRAILHLHWLHPYSRDQRPVRALVKSLNLACGLALAKRLGTRVVWTAHNLADHENRRPTLDRANRRAVLRHADAIIAHSDEAGRVVGARLEMSDASSIRVIPHGHWIDVFPNTVGRAAARSLLGLDDRAFVILFLGRIREYKGVDDLVEAFRRLPDSNLVLIVAGSAHSVEVERRLRQLASTDRRIRLELHHVPNDEVQNFMNAADVVALPYREILTSGAAVLAMSFGKVCIAPRTAHLKDVFAEEDVFHYEPGDLLGLADALQRAIDVRSRLVDRGAGNLERAREWSWSSIARMTRAVYLEVLGRTGRSGAARET